MDTATTTTTRRATVVAVLALIAVTALTGRAAAHLLAHADPDDTTAPFDIASARLERDGANLVATVRTYEVMRDRHFQTGDAILAEFDSRGDGRGDFTLRLEYYEGAYPYCSLYDAQGFSVAGGTATKGRRSMTCQFQRSDLDITRHIRWRVSTSTYGDPDRAPDRGWYGH